MAFAARRSIAARLSHHLTRRVHPCVPHALTSHSTDEQASSSPALPTPLPPLHTPLQRRSGAAQTLGGLPFSLHLAGPTRRSFSSSAPAPDLEPTPVAEVDAAGVLADAAEAAAAAVPAPFPGEVAAAAADSFLPVAALQHLIDAVHTFTGLNWWACIALTTLIIRTATIPLLVNQLKSMTKLNAIKPEMEAIKDQTDTMDLKSAQEGKAKMDALFKKHGVSPFAPMKGLLIQGPVFVSFFFAISNMVEKVPSMKGGGALWFTDLTTPDSLYLLPVVTGLTAFATVEFNLQQGMEGTPMTGKMKNVARGMAFLTVPFTMNFAKLVSLSGKQLSALILEKESLQLKFNPKGPETLDPVVALNLFFHSYIFHMPTLRKAEDIIKRTGSPVETPSGKKAKGGQSQNFSAAENLGEAEDIVKRRGSPIETPGKKANGGQSQNFSGAEN